MENQNEAKKMDETKTREENIRAAMANGTIEDRQELEKGAAECAKIEGMIEGIRMHIEDLIGVDGLQELRENIDMQFNCCGLADGKTPGVQKMILREAFGRIADGFDETIQRLYDKR